MADTELTDPPAPTPEDAPADNQRSPETPAPDTAPTEDDPKPRSENGAAYEARKANERAKALEKELEGYKRRDEDTRKAKLTEDERLKEELKIAQDKVARLETKALQDKVAAEYKLPPVLGARLIGSDEDSLRADAEELAKLLPPRRGGSPTDPARDTGQKTRIYTRAELQADPKLAASDEVRQANAEGRVK